METNAKIKRIQDMKNKEKIAMLTAYDHHFAATETKKGIDIILVGDSANFVLNGSDTTRGITIEELAKLTQRVVKGVNDYGGLPLVISDLPAGSYENVADAVKNAQMLKDAGADAIKLEGGTEKENLVEIVPAIIKQGIPIQGHIGYTPQSVTLVDEGHVQGKTEKAIEKLFADQKLLTEKGIFSIIYECIPWKVSQVLTEKSSVPSIGIGSGPYCDGQVLVVYDLLSLTPHGKFKFVWNYDCDAPTAIENYVKDVKSGEKPTLKNSFKLKDPEFLEKFRY